MSTTWLWWGRAERDRVRREEAVIARVQGRKYAAGCYGSPWENLRDVRKRVDDSIERA